MALKENQYVVDVEIANMWLSEKNDSYSFVVSVKTIEDIEGFPNTKGLKLNKYYNISYDKAESTIKGLAGFFGVNTNNINLSFLEKRITTQDHIGKRCSATLTFEKGKEYKGKLSEWSVAFLNGSPVLSEKARDNIFNILGGGLPDVNDDLDADIPF